MKILWLNWSSGNILFINIHYIISLVRSSVNWRDNQMSWSGNSNLESAVNWLLEHESDPDIDRLPLVGYFLTMQIFFISTSPLFHLRYISSFMGTDRIVMRTSLSQCHFVQIVPLKFEWSRFHEKSPLNAVTHQMK